jgi:hypothetical protein
LPSSQTATGLAFPALLGLTVIVALELGGCGAGAPAPPPPPPSTVAIALGGAAADGSGFVDLGGDVSLVPGSQGGFHFWMKYRVTGLTGATGSLTEMVHIAYTVRRISDDRLILTAERQQQLGPPGDGGYWETPTAIPAFMCPSPLGVQVRDEPLRLKLDMTDSGGQPLAGAQAELTPHCPDGDQAAFCIGICSG